MTGVELKALRETRGHSQAQAAALVGVSRRTWQYWERSKNLPFAGPELYRRLTK